jgi:hypothetical protein
MLLAVTGLGRIWKRHRTRDGANANRKNRGAVFYNTTGVVVCGVVRPRSRIYGIARFDCASGFPAHDPERVLNRVVECTDPCASCGENRIVFKCLARPASAIPTAYLVVVRSELTGWIDVAAPWHADSVFVLSFSQSSDQQEIMLVMPRFSWLRSTAGLYLLEPEPPGSRAMLVQQVEPSL